MRFRSVQTAKLDPLDRHWESAHAATVALFREVLESASERLSILWRADKTAHIERSLAAGACTDAALALLELEMPNWKIRRLVNEGGEWLCSLSRRLGQHRRSPTFAVLAASCAGRLSQKWMIKSLAAMTAQFLDGGIPAAALPLNASAFSER
jgi:hypothetical protein